jgi:hypothetical protein
MLTADGTRRPSRVVRLSAALSNRRAGPIVRGDQSLERRTHMIAGPGRALQPPRVTPSYRIWQGG